jgi:hypothetical protein
LIVVGIPVSVLPEMFLLLRRKAMMRRKADGGVSSSWRLRFPCRKSASVRVESCQVDMLIQ